ncbi:MAG: ABC transporter ATP-binding protein [Proteobacteria bacterium]|nr:ABC transporter ATP-binding protein [Pseudomonadota bacterium]
MLALSNVEVKYENIILVLKGVSLEVKEKQIVALLGANGAGKTTTLKAISGLLKTENGRVTQGTIDFLGQRIENGNPEDITRMGIMQVLEGRRIFEHLTTEENLLVGCRFSAEKLKNNLDMVYAYFPKLKDLKHRICGYLSGGEQQMVVIGRALMKDPKLILFDEPSLGLAPILVQEIFSIIRTIHKDQDKSILIVEQSAVATLSVADFAYVMENGRIVMDGSADKMMQNEDIKEFYLGMSSGGKKKNFREIKHYKRRKRWMS